MILYHGSNIDITDIDLSQSKVGKDFGCGFYLSADKEQALALAKRKTEQIGTGNPVLNVYEFDETNLQSADLSVLHFQTYSQKWAEFILMNRRNRTRTPAHDYDIVIGPIANDAVGLQIKRYDQRNIYDRRNLQGNRAPLDGRTRYGFERSPPHPLYFGYLR